VGFWDGEVGGTIGGTGDSEYGESGLDGLGVECLCWVKQGKDLEMVEGGRGMGGNC